MHAISYEVPAGWIQYDKAEIFNELTTAKAAVIALQTMPFQRRWVEELQQIQLKMESRLVLGRASIGARCPALARL